jgi:hypothetical protein
MTKTGSDAWRTRRFAIIVVAFLVIYLVVSLSPLRESIGRQFPRVAAIFSPPWFNFEAAYRTGNVLEFRVGMSRMEFARALLDHYASHAVLRGGCGDDTKIAIPDFEIKSDEGSAALRQKQMLCLWDAERKLRMTVILNHDSVSEVRVAVINNSI